MSGFSGRSGPVARALTRIAVALSPTGTVTDGDWNDYVDALETIADAVEQGGGSSAGNLTIKATYELVPDEEEESVLYRVYALDKTFDEILEAYQDGSNIVLASVQVVEGQEEDMAEMYFLDSVESGYFNFRSRYSTQADPLTKTGPGTVAWITISQGEEAANVEWYEDDVWKNYLPLVVTCETTDTSITGSTTLTNFSHTVEEISDAVTGYNRLAVLRIRHADSHGVGRQVIKDMPMLEFDPINNSQVTEIRFGLADTGPSGYLTCYNVTLYGSEQTPYAIGVFTLIPAQNNA